MLRDSFDVSDVVCQAEEDARLRGVMRMLALPDVVTLDGTTRRREVEIEVAPGLWALVDAVSIDVDGATFSFGVNGRRVEYRFVRGERMPRWRVDANVPRYPMGTEREHDTRPFEQVCDAD